MERYIIYTCGIKEINEAVQKVLFEKGYEWPDGGVDFRHQEGAGVATGFYDTKPFKHIVTVREPMNEHWKDHKEITFRELCELPPVHDEEERLASFLYGKITDYWADNIASNDQPLAFREWVEQQNWCKVREKVEKKLGL